MSGSSHTHSHASLPSFLLKEQDPEGLGFHIKMKISKATPIEGVFQVGIVVGGDQGS